MDTNLLNLEGRVNKMMSVGWTPIGGIFLLPPDREFKRTDVAYYQAMIRPTPLPLNS